MAFPDLSDIRTRIRAVVNESSTSTFLTAAILNRWINDAERDIAIKTGCLENIDSLTTTASSRLVQFSGYKVKYVEYVPAGTRVGMQKITPKHLGHVPLNGSQPQYWFQWGRYIVIEPLPGATTYTIYAYIADYPTVEMSSDTDEPQIPTECHESIIDYAVYRYLLRDKKFQLAVPAYATYINKLQGIRNIYWVPNVDPRTAIKIPDIVQKGGR